MVHGEARKGRQEPTASVVLPYEDTAGLEAIDLYQSTGRECYPWEQLLIADIMGMDPDGLWVHQKFGFEVPRRNGKNEVIAMRELYGLTHGEQMCHTAHRQTTASSAFRRLAKFLVDAGYTEIDKRFTTQELPEKAFHSAKAYGLEAIEVLGDNGGKIVFRTRTANGGLGEGFDLLVIDEAQEYTEAQESALIYTVTDSANPQTLFCGTPPTAISAGHVFEAMRASAFDGSAYATGWAEWSIDYKPDDYRTDIDAWYECNPSLGYHLDERKIRAEIRGDDMDFMIQRLGYWYTYNLQSAINPAEWDALTDPKPKLSGKIYVGIKYGKDAANVAVSIAVRTAAKKIFVESLGYRQIRDGSAWIIDFLRRCDPGGIIIDGAPADLLINDLNDFKIKPKAQKINASQFILANAGFTQGIADGSISHAEQDGVRTVISNCERRGIGSNGGFGYKAQRDGIEIAVLDSIIIAYWLCNESKAKRTQKINY